MYRSGYLWVYACKTGACRCQRCWIPPRTGVAGSCGCCEPNSSHLQKECVLLSTESSVQLKGRSLNVTSLVSTYSWTRLSHMPGFCPRKAEGKNDSIKGFPGKHFILDFAMLFMCVFSSYHS